MNLQPSHMKTETIAICLKYVSVDDKGRESLCLMANFYLRKHVERLLRTKKIPTQAMKYRKVIVSTAIILCFLTSLLSIFDFLSYWGTLKDHQRPMDAKDLRFHSSEKDRKRYLHRGYGVNDSSDDDAQYEVSFQL